MQSAVSRHAAAIYARHLPDSVFSSREILRMLVPTVLDSLSIFLINMLITALIGRSGETSVAAVNLVSPLTGLITCLFNSIAAGGTVIIARAWGMGGGEQLSRAAGHILWIIFLAGSACCVPFLLFPRAAIELFYPAAEPVVMQKAAGYLAGCAVSVLIFTIYTGVFCILRGLGESKRCLVLTIIINVAYLVFSVLFINVLEMDIQGSALALILARVAGSAAGIVLLMLWRPPIDLPLRAFFSFDSGLIRSLASVSIPFCVEQLFASGGGLIMTMFMAPLGTAAIAAHAIANSLLGVMNGAAQAAGTLAVTVVGRCTGAGLPEEARRYGKGMNWLARLLVVLSAAVMVPLLPLLLPLYRPSEAVYSLTMRLLLFTLPALLLFWPLSNTLPNTLRAAGDTVFPSALALIAMWGVRIGLGYWLAIRLQMGLLGVWAAMWTEWGVRALALSLRFSSGKWMKKAAAGHSAL